MKQRGAGPRANPPSRRMRRSRQETDPGFPGTSRPFAQHVAAVMIDLDGTLLDTVPDLAAAAARMLAALGLAGRTQAEIRDFIGKGIPNLVRRCLQASA